jgi:hypothetical protein
LKAAHSKKQYLHRYRYKNLNSNTLTFLGKRVTIHENKIKIYSPDTAIVCFSQDSVYPMRVEAGYSDWQDDPNSISGNARFFSSPYRPDRLYPMGTGDSFSGGKAAGQ